MLKLARFIVDKRKAFYLIFLASFIFCAVSISKVHVNDDITTYLPAHTETRRGLTLMDEEFITLGSANIMVSNITYDAAYNLSLKSKRSLVSLLWNLMIPRTITTILRPCSLFPSMEEEGDPDTAVLLQVEQLLEGYDYYPSTTVGRDESASLQQEMTVILAIAAVVIVVVLLFTSKAIWRSPST